MRRNQHLSAHKPVSCISDKISNSPELVIKVKFRYRPYFPVKVVQCVYVSSEEFQQAFIDPLEGLIPEIPGSLDPILIELFEPDRKLWMYDIVDLLFPLQKGMQEI